MWDYPGDLERERKRSILGAIAGNTDDALDKEKAESPLCVQHERRTESVGEVRLVKVLRLRAAIANGTYAIPLDELAVRMMRRVHRQTEEDMYSV